MRRPRKAAGGVVQNVEICTEHPHLRIPRKETLRIVRMVFRGEKRNVLPMTVVYTSSRRIRRINRTFLRHDRPTDVIAFSLSNGGGMNDEIYVNLDYAKSQAREYGVSFRNEASRLLVHGCLHLLGYSDASKSERSRMKLQEDRYLGETDAPGNPAYA